MINPNNSDNITSDLYVKVRDKTVIFYTKTQQIDEDKIEELMIESIPYDYQDIYS